MAWSGYYGEPLYVSYPDYARYEELVPATTFREPPFYDDVYYRRDFRHHHPDLGRDDVLRLVPREQVLLRREDPATAPWWHNPDYPHNGHHHGYPVFVRLEHEPADDSVAELYVPQLCCDSCEHRVLECLNDMAGVENVTADQWTRKVVVAGRNLRPDDVLRRLQRDLHMPRSVFWHDRRT